jgi:hypothetical protein
MTQLICLLHVLVEGTPPPEEKSTLVLLTKPILFLAGPLCFVMTLPSCFNFAA